MCQERVHKALSRMGLGSRRELERLIEQGEITINGKTAELGASVKSGDRVYIGKKRVIIRPVESRPRVLMYHKPVGEVCTRKDEQGRPTVFKHLPRLKNERWINVGRLDINTSGLLLFTNHGELANRLMHPKQQVEREYAVRVNGRVSDAIIKQLQTNVELDDGPAHFIAVRDAGGQGINHWFHVVLAEGRNREVRRLWEAAGVRVSRLVRVRYADVVLPRSLRQGKHSELDPEQVKLMMASVGLKQEKGDINKRQRPRSKKSRSQTGKRRRR